jgi:hypothetical protein
VLPGQCQCTIALRNPIRRNADHAGAFSPGAHALALSDSFQSRANKAAKRNMIALAALPRSGCWKYPVRLHIAGL